METKPNRDDLSSNLGLGALLLLSDREEMDALNQESFSRVLNNFELLTQAYSELEQTCEYTLSQIDYLQNLWGKEGVTDGIRGRLQQALDFARGVIRGIK